MLTLFNSQGEPVDVGAQIKSYGEPIAKQKLTGKILLAVGDSYTDGGLDAKLNAIAVKYGMVLDNIAVTGSTIAIAEYGSSMCTAVDNAVSAYTLGKTINGATYHASDVGIITFMGGANDSPKIEDNIGTGIHCTAKSTIYGALNYIFNALQSTFTGAIMICITQPSNYYLTTSIVDTDVKAQALGFANVAEVSVLNDVQFTNYTMAMKESAVRIAAQTYSIPTIDMFADFPPICNASNRSTYWATDKLHLTAAGYNIIAAAIEDKLVELMQ